MTLLSALPDLLSAYVTSSLTPFGGVDPHVDWRDAFLMLLSPLFFAVVVAEWLRMRGEKRQGKAVYDWRDSRDSMVLGGVYTWLDVVLVLVFVLPAMNWVHTHHRLTSIELTPLSFAALYLGVEFCYYWFHRASHRIRWFWCAHVVHHGSEHMNFTTAMRQSWLYTFAGNWLFYLPMVWIGFEPKAVLLALSFNLGYQFFVHTQWVGKLHPLIELIFNTPSHHRAHHGRNPRYIDKNYGGTLIVFDRLFGTFVEETEAVDYGLVRQVHTHNPFWLTLHEWAAMLRDVMRPGPLSLRLKHIWAPPEWERPGTQAADNRAHASESAPRPHDPAHP
ncbi:MULTISPECIES: sterol desaturase family protein [Aquabacterium]|jgi:sterol desaturase/sphingolipid hydroxylase (fatty acid hydroxylase superfamily)|uniref:sterol desaturase family protein n=1 Tax=Aquabacterium TaxID=92793 RepID=UPI0009FAC360|nr:MULTISPECIES: sterol desaturase family protein [Aquabacterium]